MRTINQSTCDVACDIAKRGGRAADLAADLWLAGQRGCSPGRAMLIAKVNRHRERTGTRSKRSPISLGDYQPVSPADDDEPTGEIIAAVRTVLGGDLSDALIDHTRAEAAAIIGASIRTVERRTAAAREIISEILDS